MIAHAAVDAGAGAKSGQRAQAIVHGITAGGDQIAGDQGQIGAGFVGHGHGAVEVLAAEERAQMNVGQMDQAEAFEVRRQTGDLQFLFPHAKPGAFDKRAIGQHGGRRGEQDGAERGEEMATRGMMHGRQNAPDQPQHGEAGEP